MENTEIWVNKLLEPAGVKINGNNSWDIKVLNKNLYNRVKTNGSLGLGEAYMDGWWECEKLDEFFYKILSSGIYKKIGLSFSVILGIVCAKLFNLQAIKRAFQVGERHYDTGNDLFEPMLGKTMAYSCGYWRNAKSLDSAETAKFDLICKKLNLKKGQRILDIGCGWGGFAYHAVKNYGVSVVGITVSKEQKKFAEEICKGLPVEIRLQDYRQLNEKFDHIVSIGMFEHVGLKNYRTYFEIARKCLSDNGLFLLHTIGDLKSGNNNSDPWLNKYIFPNGSLPSLKQATEAAEGIFVVEDIHNFGADYDRTLMAWHKNFNNVWPKLRDKYGDKFFRMWNYYLLCCAGSFRARNMQLWQIVLSSRGVVGGYKFVR